jgi:hypothetical protein
MCPPQLARRELDVREPALGASVAPTLGEEVSTRTRGRPQSSATRKKRNISELLLVNQSTPRL